MSPPAYRSIVDDRRPQLRSALRILRFAVPHRRLLALTVLLLLALAFLQLVGPWAIKQAVDSGIGGKDSGALLQWILVFGGASLVLSYGEYLKVRTTVLMGQRVVYDVRNRLFRHLNRLSLRYHDRQPVGTSVTRTTSDVEALSEMFSSGVATIFGDLILVLVILVGLFLIEARLALVVLVVLPVVALISVAFGRRMRKAFRRVRLSLSSLNGYQQEAFSGLGVTRLFRRERTAQDGFDAANGRYLDANLGAINVFSLYWPVMEVLSSAAYAGIVTAGAAFIGGGSISWGDFFFFWTLLPRFFQPIRNLSDNYNVLQAALAAAERIFEVLDEEPDVRDPEAPAPLKRLEGRVGFKDVSFRYLPDEPVLRGIDFEVEPGQTVALVGPTGSGKTSIISLLNRLWDVQEGRVEVDGTDVRAYAARELRARIAVVLQDVFLFTGTVADNVRIANPELSDEEVRRACETVNASTFIEKLPGGYQAEIRERGSNLSVGQRQLLAFARALAADPDILVLDEATSSIDTHTELLIQEALGRLLEGRTAIVIAHRLSTIRRADQILVLCRGQVVERGKHEELLRQGGLYARLNELSQAASSLGEDLLKGTSTSPTMGASERR